MQEVEKKAASTSISGTPVYIPVIAGVIVLLVLGVVGECAARIVYQHRAFFRGAILNDYQVLDPHDRHLCRLRPGFHETLAQAIADKQRSGRVLGAEYLKTRARLLGIQAGDVVLPIDSDGYKGPEVDRSHSHFRILTLGDSCTFGSMFDRYSYPRSLETELRRMGVNAEVVNGGVEGYSPRHLLARIDEFRALKPDVTTIYIGWNALYGYEALPDAKFHFYLPWLFRMAYSCLFPERTALAAYQRARHPDRNDPELQALNGYEPPFLNDVREIVRQMKAGGSTVVLLTLLGLYSTHEPPSPRALQIGHLPLFTDNPYVLARMAEEYNQRLKEIAGQMNVRIIDLEEWADTALEPRDQFFADSVHLYEPGQQALGEYLAGQLAPLAARQSSSAEGQLNSQPHRADQGVMRPAVQQAQR